MNTEIKTRWLEALRGGEYTQTTGALCVMLSMVGTGAPREKIRPVGHCCLGVLCEILEEVSPLETDDVSENGDVVKAYGGEIAFLPRKYREISGITRDPYVNIPDYNLRGARYSLSVLNDGGLTFAQIADVIEYFL